VPPRRKKSQRLLQLLQDLVHNRARRRPLDHPYCAKHKIRFVEVWIAFAIGWTVFINAAPVVPQKRTRLRSRLPGILLACFGPLQIRVYELLPRHSQAQSQAVDLLFPKRWLHFAATIGACGAVDSRPNLLGCVEDSFVDIGRVKPALRLQELAKFPVFIRLFLGGRAKLNKIGNHNSFDDVTPRSSLQAEFQPRFPHPRECYVEEELLQLPEGEGRMGWGYYPPYVSVAERQAKAARAVLKLTRKGTRVSPVKIAGRIIASTFWGKAWCDNLESYSDFSNRLPRGRTYCRNGSVVDLQIEPGKVTSLVSGSSLYRIAIEIRPLAAPYWKTLKTQCGSQIGSLVELLQGRLSKSVMEIVTQRNNGLFPTPKEIEMSCSCPDWAGMCKHIAATLYAVGNRLDHEPELFFKLRQVDHLELIAEAAQPEAKPESGGRKKIAASQLADVFGIELETSENTPETPVAAKPIQRRKPTPPEEKKAGPTDILKQKRNKLSGPPSKTNSRGKPISATERKLIAKALSERWKMLQQTRPSAGKAVAASPSAPAKAARKTKSAQSRVSNSGRQRKAAS